MNSADLNEIDREVNLLRDAGSHQNVIIYKFAVSALWCLAHCLFHVTANLKEKSRSACYIVFELCWKTLDDFVKEEDVRNACTATSAFSLLKQVINGVVYLHSAEIPIGLYFCIYKGL